MGLDEIWDEDGEWLTKKSKGFRARSTGCSCCSIELDSEDDVKKETIDSFHWILRAARYFKWDIDNLLKEARKELQKEK